MMDKIAGRLTQTMIQKGMIEKEDAGVYKYGFCIMMEVGFFVLTCSILMFLMKMPLEGVLFFLVFSPLRSYAGGLHLKKFSFCYVASCLIFVTVLLLVKNVSVPADISFCILAIAEITLWRLNPVENVNRSVDATEHQYFKKKLRLFLSIDLLIGISCLLLQLEKYLFEITLIVLVVILMMFAGN